MASLQTEVQIGLTEELREGLAELRETRRERIATAVLAGISASVRHATNPTAEIAAIVAVKWADALIAELDK